MARVVSQRRQQATRATTLARPSIHPAIQPSIHLAHDLYQIRRLRQRRWQIRLKRNTWRAGTGTSMTYILGFPKDKFTELRSWNTLELAPAKFEVWFLANICQRIPCNRREGPWRRGTIHRFYRLRSKTNSSLRPTIIRSKIIASTVLMSTIFKSTQNSQYKNCFYSINVYRS